MNAARSELTAEDYAYLPPDHWVLHNREPDEIFYETAFVLCQAGHGPHQIVRRLTPF